MNRLLTFLSTVALGVSAMYYLDPELGRRRRAEVSRRMDGLSHDTRDYLDKQRKRGVDRLQGAVARMRGRLESRPMSDQQLHGRLRSRLGRAVSYPHGIETEVQQGRVQLRGHVLADEFNVLMTEIWSLPGVTAVDSQLSLHSEPGGMPVLSGVPNRITRARLSHLGRSSLPALALVGGLGAGLRGLSRQGASKAGLLSLAAALLAYGMGSGATRIARQRWGQARRTSDMNQAAAASMSSAEAADTAAGLGVLEQPLPSSPTEALPTTPGTTPSPWH